jgi:uncharacterized protein (DUF488 family)
LELRAAGRLSRQVATVGHSTRSIEDLIAILRAHGVEQIADVRRFPASRRHPQFGREALEHALEAAEIGYLWIEDLGGRRRSRPGSRHTAWRVAGFAGYADYMETPEFERAATGLMDLARERRTAILCAEARPEQCHRRLIADWLTVHGVEVVHLLDVARTAIHRLPEFARVEDGRLIYDGGQMNL